MAETLNNNILPFMIPSNLVIGSVALRHLGVSRHNFEKAVERCLITKYYSEIDTKTYYSLSELDAFKQTQDYKDM
ncbi:MAG: hypothetical protein K2L34_07465, partial [Muribaculaceae bacterium]|nr:hypothetical protein [Muribaculaceae bacterium]